MELVNLENLFFISPDWEEQPKHMIGSLVRFKTDRTINRVEGVLWGTQCKCWRYLFSRRCGDRLSLSESDIERSPTSIRLPSFHAKPKFLLGQVVSLPILRCDRTLVSGIALRGDEWAYFVRYSFGWIWVSEEDICGQT